MTEDIIFIESESYPLNADETCSKIEQYCRDQYVRFHQLRAETRFGYRRVIGWFEPECVDPIRKVAYLFLQKKMPPPPFSAFQDDIKKYKASIQSEVSEYVEPIPSNNNDGFCEL